MSQIKELKGYMGKSVFVAVSKNAYVECDENGAPKFDRGEVEIAKLFGVEFPDKEIRVSIGAWRSYDITGKISKNGRTIFVDIYSVRCPSVKSDYVTDLISNAHRVLNGKQLTPEQQFKV